MNYSETYLNSVFNETYNFINNLSFKYDKNIIDLLNIIIPAFILKYDYNNKKYIYEVFNDTRIIINNTGNETIPAYYKKTPRNIDNKLTMENIIVIQNMNDIIDLLDSLVHEFNHAINSRRNSYVIKNNFIYNRIGLSYMIFNDKLEFISKENNYILEEIINTKETEEIIDIINNFKNIKYLKDNKYIYFLNNHIEHKFKSTSYYIELEFIKELINNNAFISNLEKLRFEGYIDDIPNWFNNIIGNNNAYKNLIDLLIKLKDLEENYPKNILNKIKWRKDFKNIYKDLKQLIYIFNSNSNFS